MIQTITLIRLIHTDEGIISRFVAPGLGQTIWGLERSWNMNARENSCIPEGVYSLHPHSGPRFQDVWGLSHVPARSAILIHPANLPGELQGCIAPGLSYKLMPSPSKPSYYKASVVSSRAACRFLFSVIQRLHDSGGVQLLIKNHRATLSDKEPQA